MDEYKQSGLLEKICTAARHAGAIMLEGYGHHMEVDTKAGHANFVTEYDEKVQEYLVKELSHLLPDAHFVGEEEGREVFLDGYRTGWTFVIDPIDGTTNYMKGYPVSMTSIGLLRDGLPYIGAAYNPFIDVLFYAQKGQGAFRNGKRIFSSGRPLKESLVSVGTAPYAGAKTSGWSCELAKYFVREAIDIRRSGSAVWDVCMIAGGACGLFFEPVLGLWDFAASACILTEAGGRITDMDGNALTFDRGGSVVAVSRGVAGEDYLALFREHP